MSMTGISNNGKASVAGDEQRPQPDSPPGLFDILDLTQPLRKIYLAVLKNGDVSQRELSELLKEEAPEELRIYLNLLSRLAYFEKYADNNEIRFRIKGRIRGKNSLPNEVWEKLEAGSNTQSGK